jgi:16S rRNA (guanine1516-N2)-methyltransferase
MSEVARDIAERFNLPRGQKPDDSKCRFVLGVSSRGLFLQDRGQPRTRPLQLSTSDINRRSSGRDLLARSIGRNCRTVVDATAGFGRDAFHLFRLGKHVTAVERSSVVTAMLADAIDRLVSGRSSGSLRLIFGDAHQSLIECEPPDVVYLDPMFPNGAGRSALAGKESRMLRGLVGEDADAESLFLVAQSVALQRVVVKRPVSAAPLVGKPDIEFRGQVIRYDAYLTLP